MTIDDEQFCSPIPGALGAVCDNFLTSDQQIKTQEEWLALQAQWNASGLAVECMSSQAVGDLKREVEELCSQTQCDENTKQIIVSGLAKIEKLGKGSVEESQK